MKKITLLLFIGLIILSSGCVKINSTQQIKRDGLIDMVILINSPYELVLNSINQSLITNPQYSNFTQIITNNTIIYYFENINTSSQNLFLNNKTDDFNIDTNGMFSGKTYSLTKNFKFPYYYYNYTIYIETPIVDDSILFNTDSLLEETSLMDIEYDVIYFGKLVQTNGQEVDKNKIRFNESVTNEITYYLTFKEFFLANWFNQLTNR